MPLENGTITEVDTPVDTDGKRDVANSQGAQGASKTTADDVAGDKLAGEEKELGKSREGDAAEVSEGAADQHEEKKQKQENEEAKEADNSELEQKKELQGEKKEDQSADAEKDGTDEQEQGAVEPGTIGTAQDAAATTKVQESEQGKRKEPEQVNKDCGIAAAAEEQVKVKRARIMAKRAQLELDVWVIPGRLC